VPSEFLVNGPDRPQRPEEIWDRFIDALDNAGQREGGPHGILVPEGLAASATAGRPFGELARQDVAQLARLGSALGRRGDTILVLWQDMQQRRRGPRKRQRRRSS
jgi:hypothetical protein